MDKRKAVRFLSLIIIAVAMVGMASAAWSDKNHGDGGSWSTSGSYDAYGMIVVPQQDLALTGVDAFATGTEDWYVYNCATNNRIWYGDRSGDTFDLPGIQLNSGTEYFIGAYHARVYDGSGSSMPYTDGQIEWRYRVYGYDTGQGCGDSDDTSQGDGAYDLHRLRYEIYAPTVDAVEDISPRSKNDVLVSFVASDSDTNGEDDFTDCTLDISDGDGNTATHTLNIDRSYGNSNQVRCYKTIQISGANNWNPGEMLTFNVTATSYYGSNSNSWNYRVSNLFLRLQDSNDNNQNDVNVTVYRADSSTVSSTGDGAENECDGQSGSNGWFSCGLDSSYEHDIKVDSIPKIKDIDFDSDSETRVLHYNQYDSSELDKYHYLNVTGVNQTADRLSDANYSVTKAGTSQEFFMTEQNTDDGEIQVPLDPREIYDVEVDTSKFRDDLVFRNSRVPDVIQSGFNQNFLPESTLANSIKYSAGHVVSAQTLVNRPFSNFDVVNITAEKNLSSEFRMVSEVLVKKFNKDNTVSTCSSQPESSTYFFIDEADCTEFGKMNVSQDEWFRMDYRFRIPGPESFGGAGSTNEYNVSDTIIRFDVL